VIATRDQKNESKRLGAELLKLEQSGRKNTKEYRNLEQQYRRVTQAAQRGDRQLKKLDRTVGDNFRNVGNYRSALGKLSGALSSLGIAFGSAIVIRNVFSVVKDFDQAQANLASVLGVSRDQMSQLTETAKELGATTRFTASQVSELQLEFAKLGFSQTEINNVTKATLELASATNTDLAEASAVVGHGKIFHINEGGCTGGQKCRIKYRANNRNDWNINGSRY
jgi:chromosome segregation ATPase